MKAIALIEKGKDNKFHIYSKGLKSLIVGEGDSVEEAKADFENTTQEIISTYPIDKLPKELQNLSFEYHFDIGALFNYYDFINMSKLAKRIGISDSLMRRYKIGEYISQTQLQKIEDALHDIGKDFSEIKLFV